MNIQELATVKYHKLPIKIFLLSNEGYHSIRQTQSRYFPDNITGCGPDSGLMFPDFKLIANGYGLKYIKISNTKELESKISKVLDEKESIICEILIDKNQEFEPKATSKLFADGRMKSVPLFDLHPFLDEEVVNEIISFENY